MTPPDTSAPAPAAAARGPAAAFDYLAGYHFADLTGLPALRATLRDAGRALDVRGTVLLTPEGINLFVSAPPDAAAAFLAHVRAQPGLAALRVHRSAAADSGFNRFLVKIKHETITFRRPGIRPADGRALAVAPDVLSRWLDAGHDDDGRPVALLDTRNAFEVGIGSFDGAIDPGIGSFTELPDAVRALRERLHGHRVVTFCTGGIRCEKAALWMDEAGIDDVVQLDGGVLGYFDAVGGRHWHGELFVFDRRVALTPQMQPGRWRQDFATRDVLRAGPADADAAGDDAAGDDAAGNDAAGDDAAGDDAAGNDAAGGDAAVDDGARPGRPG